MNAITIKNTSNVRALRVKNRNEMFLGDHHLNDGRIFHALSIKSDKVFTTSLERKTVHSLLGYFK